MPPVTHTFAPGVIPTEHQEQAALCRWWAVYCKQQGIPERLLFHIPNEAHRSYTLAARLRSEGMRAGVPDLCLAVPRGSYGALFIEMKRTKHWRLSDEQKAALSDFEGAGNRVAVCKGAAEAMDVIQDYLRG